LGKDSSQITKYCTERSVSKNSRTSTSQDLCDIVFLFEYFEYKYFLRVYSCCEPKFLLEFLFLAESSSIMGDDNPILEAIESMPAGPIPLFTCPDIYIPQVGENFREDFVWNARNRQS
jgi:hypothetical protein